MVGHSQPIWQWANSFQGGGDQSVLDIAVDASTGTSYISGYFDNSIGTEFPTGLNGTPDMSSSLGTVDGFVGKHDINGNVIWGFKIGGAGATVEVESISLGPTGDIYVTGEFFGGTVDFQGVTTSISNTQTPTGATKDMFLAAYNSSGELLWVTRSTDTGNSIGFAVTSDANGIYVTGRFGGDITFPPLASITWSAATFFDAYVAKFDFSGNAVWVKTIAGTTGNGHVKGWNVATDGTNVYAVGTSRATSWSYYPGVNPLSSNISGGTDDIWVISLDESTANLNWEQVIGGTNDDMAKGIATDGTGVYLTGGINDAGTLVSFPGTAGVSTANTGQDIFSGRLFSATGLADWVYVEKNSTSTDAYGKDIVLNGLGTAYITGSMSGTTGFGSGTTSLVATNFDMFVMSRKTVGTFAWAESSNGSGNDEGTGIGYDDLEGVQVAGYHVKEITFGSVSILNSGGDNGFLARMATCAPIITSCQADLTVTADPTCNYTIGDYTSGVVASDPCSNGLTVVQSPLAGTILTAGTHTITLTVTEGGGLTDDCTFDLTIEADINPIVVNCGSLLVGQTTFGSGNDAGLFACSGTPTPGEDVYYQITVPVGNYLLGVSISNASDVNDTDINTFWVGGSCPLGSSCTSNDNYNIADQDFDSNGQNQLIFSAAGPGTYYFVVDSESDGIDSYDIEFSCIVSGIEFDETGCGLDTDNDGLHVTVDASTTLDVEPCETVSICHTLYIQNAIAGEWMDTVNMELNSCYTNVVPTSVGGFYDGGGMWNAIYDVPTNSIEWGFDYSGGQLWGDGLGTNYNCRTYSFCFTADITSSCSNSADLDIEILIEDDGIDGALPGSTAGFDYASSNNFNLINAPDASFLYPANTYCQTSSNPIASITGTTGGLFSSTAGLVFANTSTGEINLAGSTPGSYVITYSIGLCPTTQTFNITIEAPQTATFTYPLATYCNTATNPVPTPTVAGGTYTGAVGIVFTDGSPSATGTIDLAASTIGGPYVITYTTPNSCAATGTFNVTIETSQNATFTYPLATYCNTATNPVPTPTVAGGTYTGAAGIVFTDGSPSATGTIDLAASTLGGPYTITYLTPNSCAATGTFNVTIEAPQVATFAYSSVTYCNTQANPIPTPTIAGGTYTGAAGIIFTDANPISPTGTIDLAASTAGGPYTVTYTTPNSCAVIGTFNVTIVAPQNASFTYPLATYCNTATNPIPTPTVTGGTYTGAAGIVFTDGSPSATGTIDLAASTVGGPYTITYTTPNKCAVTGTFNVTIETPQVATFTYPLATYCNTATNPVPTPTVTGGTYTGAAGIVFTDGSPSATGTIDLTASTIGGPYTITYTTPNSCAATGFFDVTIEAPQVTTFTYPLATYCNSATNPIPTPTVAGGTYTGAAGIVFTDGSPSATGTIDLAGSTAGGPYTITYLTPNSCGATGTFDVTIEAPQVTTFTYPLATYCNSATNPVPTPTVTGGTYTGAAGIVFTDGLPSATGTIDLTASTIGGPYTIAYTTPNSCAATGFFDVTIEAPQVTTFTYPSATYCNSATNPIPTPTVAGGTYTGAAGIVFTDGSPSATGTIDLAASTTGGPYTITYLTPNSCGATGTFDITIEAPQTATFTYASASQCPSGTNPLPTPTLVGGTYTSAPGIVFTDGSPSATGTIDLAASTVGGPYAITYTMPNSCASTGTFNITINPEEDPSFTYANSIFCASDSDPLPTITGLTGGTFNGPSGIVFLDNNTGLIDLSACTLGGPYTISYTTAGPNCPNSTTFDISISANEDGTFTYPSAFYCSDATNPIPSISGTLGGTFTASPGIIFTDGSPSSTGEIDLLLSTAGGPYTITYTTSGGTCGVTGTLNLSIVTAGDPTFNYSTPAYCQGDLNPIPTIVSDPGGVFSGPLDIVFTNTATGEIDLASSTIGGPYTITYTTGGACSNSTTFNVSINGEDDPSFNYSFGSFCPLDPNPSANIIGTTGGIFTEGSGNIIFADANTGEIDMNASTVGGPYTITYTTSGPNCPNSTTFDVVLSLPDDPTFSYPFGGNYCQDGVNPTPTITGVALGTFSENSGSVNFISTSTGEIDLATSSAGSFWVTYTTPAGGCQNLDSIPINIIPVDDPSFSYSSSYCTDGSNPIANITGTGGGGFSESTGLVSFFDIGTGEIDLTSTAIGNYSITYTTAGACPSNTTFSIDILPLLNPVFWVPDTICANSNTVNLSDSSILSTGETESFYSYGTSGGTLLSGINNQIFAPNNSSPDDYFITHIVDNGACQDSMTLLVTILPNLNANFTSPDTVCEAIGTLNLNTFFNGTTDSGGTWIGSGVYNDSLWNVVGLNGITAISYTVGIGICQDTITKNIIVTPNVDTSWTVPNQMCESSAIVNLDLLVTGTPGGTFSGVGVSGNMFDPSIAGSGNHNITYKVGLSPCAETLTQTVTVLVNPVASAGVNMDICGLEVQLTGTTNITGAGTWSDNSGSIFNPNVNATDATASVLNYGTNTFFWTVDQSGVCSDVDSVTYSFYEQPIAYAGVDQHIDFIFESNLGATAPLNGIGSWSEENVWHQEDAESFVDELELGSNYFTWTVSNGPCPVATDQVIIYVNDIWVPDAITPNNDGKNDSFVISGIENTNNTVEIYNRWGQVIFSAINYQNDWKGTNQNGSALQDDTYFYVITINDTLTYNGFVVVKR